MLKYLDMQVNDKHRGKKNKEAKEADKKCVVTYCGEKNFFFTAHHLLLLHLTTYLHFANIKNNYFQIESIWI